jgi:hypothetical protein
MKKELSRFGWQRNWVKVSVCACTGNRKQPGLEMLHQITRILKVNIKELLTDKANNKI